MTATPLTLETELRRTEDWLSTVSNNSVIMMHAANGRFVGLNETGSRIWTLLETPATLRDIGIHLAEEFEISPEQAVADMLPLVKMLIDNGALSRVNV
ncbi:MAG: PqqD family protein [Rhizomicrobium sp.]